MQDEERNSDTETIDGASVGDEEPSHRQTTVTVDVSPDVPNFGMAPNWNVAVGFESLDEVHLVSIFNRRANVMGSIPHVLRGPYASAVRRIAIPLGLEARVGGNELKLTRAWNLFLLLLRMLLFHAPRGGKIPKPQLLERFAKFQRGQWSELVKEGAILQSTLCLLQEETEAEGRCSTPRTQGSPVCVGWGIVCSVTSSGRCRGLGQRKVDESVEAPERAQEPCAR